MKGYKRSNRLFPNSFIVSLQTELSGVNYCQTCGVCSSPTNLQSAKPSQLVQQPIQHPKKQQRYRLSGINIRDIPSFSDLELVANRNPPPHFTAANNVFPPVKGKFQLFITRLLVPLFGEGTPIVVERHPLLSSDQYNQNEINLNSTQNQTSNQNLRSPTMALNAFAANLRQLQNPLDDYFSEQRVLSELEMRLQQQQIQRQNESYFDEQDEFLREEKLQTQNSIQNQQIQQNQDQFNLNEQQLQEEKVRELEKWALAKLEEIRNIPMPVEWSQQYALQNRISRNQQEAARKSQMSMSQILSNYLNIDFDRAQQLVQENNIALSCSSGQVQKQLQFWMEQNSVPAKYILENIRMLSVPGSEIQRTMRQYLQMYRLQDTRRLLRLRPDLFYNEVVQTQQNFESVANALDIEKNCLGPVISKCPELMNMEVELIKQIVGCFKNCGFNSNQITSILQNNPSVLKPTQIERLQSLNGQIKYLKSWGIKKDQIFDVFQNFPHLILVENWKEELQQKIFYCRYKLLMPKKDVKNNFQTILISSFDEVMGPRTEFMLRKGFTKVSWGWWNCDIMFFIQQIAGCSLSQFESFVETEWEPKLCQEVKQQIQKRMKSVT